MLGLDLIWLIAQRRRERLSSITADGSIAQQQPLKVCLRMTVILKNPVTVDSDAPATLTNSPLDPSETQP